MRLFALCRELGIEEVSVYGFTKDNVRRPRDQVSAFKAACTEFAFRAAGSGAALLVIGDTRSTVFPDALRPFARSRTAGDIKVNFLVNYSWQWDLFAAFEEAAASGEATHARMAAALGSAAVSRVDLVVRWGGRQRLSGFLPVQCAYADFYSIPTLWPDFAPQEFLDALAWYQTQDVTLGG